MKRIRPIILAIEFSALSLFFITGLIFTWSDTNTFRKLQLGIIPCIVLFLGFTTKIEYYEEYFCFFSGQFKRKIKYEDIIRIYSSSNPGGYWVQICDDRIRKYMLYYPYERKKMRAFFDTIKKANPAVQIDVWWYQRQPRATILKTSLKFCLFVLIVLLADFLLHIFKK